MCAIACYMSKPCITKIPVKIPIQYHTIPYHSTLTWYATESSAHVGHGVCGRVCIVKLEDVAHEHILVSLNLNPRCQRVSE